MSSKPAIESFLGVDRLGAQEAPSVLRHLIIILVGGAKSIGFTLQGMIEEDWWSLQKMGEESWTQAIGRGGYVAKFQGLIVPSARNPGGKNIVIFPTRLAEAGKIVPLGVDQLSG